MDNDGCFQFLTFYLSSSHLTVTNAFFEAMSGLTTTGATILGSSVDKTPDIEDLSKGLLFWRSFTQFIGGMGIIVFSIAILPLLGIGGVQLLEQKLRGQLLKKLHQESSKQQNYYGVFMLDLFYS